MDREPYEHKLPAYAFNLMNEAIEISGKPMAIAEHDPEGFEARSAVARRNEYAHVLNYHHGMRPQLTHLIVHFSQEIKRLWEIPKEERCHAVAAEAHERPVNTRWSAIDQDQLAYFVERLGGAPTWIQTERDIERSLPQHRPAQRDYLTQFVQSYNPFFEAEPVHPNQEPLLEASQAIVLAMVEHAAEIAEVDPGEFYRRSPYQQIGSELSQQLHMYDRTGVRGDWVATDRWGQHLGLDGHYQWRWDSDGSAVDLV